VIYLDVHTRSQLARERADLLANEMRRARGFAPAELREAGQTRFATRLLARARQLRRSNSGRREAPAYEA
jgi:ribosomal protein L13E